MGLPDTRDYTAIPGTSPVKAATINNLQDCVVSLKKNQSAGEFGDGGDGNVTLDGVVAVGWATKVGTVYTLNQDVFCDTLILSGAGVVLKFGSAASGVFKVYCKTQFKTQGGAYADLSGTDAALNIAGAAYGAGGTVTGTTASPNGTNGNGANIAAVANAYGGIGGNGGTSLSAGGTGGTITSPGASKGRLNNICGGPLLGTIYSPSQGATAIAGGAAGAPGGGGGTVNVGGAGGNPGGVLCLAARKITLESSADIRARGGKGGDCTNSSNSGGGGGGGGGVVLLTCCSYSVGVGAINDGTMVAGGAAGLGQGAQAPAATAGHGGLIFLQVIDVSYQATTTAPASVPTALPPVYFEPLPDPANFPTNAVIVNATTLTWVITLDNLNWTALTP